MSGYWRNSARWVADGSYRSIRSDMASIAANCAMLDCSNTPIRRYCMCTPTQSSLRGSLEQVGWYSMKWKKRKRRSEFSRTIIIIILILARIRVLTEIEPEWYALNSQIYEIGSLD